MRFDPHTRFSLLEAMLKMRAQARTPAAAGGQEAVVVGVTRALQAGDIGAMLPGASAPESRLPRLYVQAAEPGQAGPGDGIETRPVDGSDVEAVLAATLDLAAAIRADGRPRRLLLDSGQPPREADAQAYVDADEWRPWQQRDPIAVLSARLIAEGVLDPGELLYLHQRIAAGAAMTHDTAQRERRVPSPALCA